MPLQSIKLDSVNYESDGLRADRVSEGFVHSDGTVDGTSGDDLIGAGYADAQTDAVDSSDGNDDYILAGAGNDTVEAGAGNDTVYGGDGNDTLYGQSGDDTIEGNFGNDIIYGGDG